MTIGSVSAATLLTPVDRTTTTQNASTQKAEPPPRAPFDPAPVLRPTIEDQIAIDRTLLTLMQL